MEEAKGPEKVRELEEVRKLKKAGEPEELEPKRLEKVGKLGELESGELDEVRGPKELKLVAGSEKIRGPGELMVALLSSRSNCWQALALATACFSRCFSFLNCLDLS